MDITPRGVVEGNAYNQGNRGSRSGHRAWDGDEGRAGGAAGRRRGREWRWSAVAGQRAVGAGGVDGAASTVTRLAWARGPRGARAR